MSAAASACKAKGDARVMFLDDRFPPEYLLARFWLRPTAMQVDIVAIGADDEPVAIVEVIARRKTDRVEFEQPMVDSLKEAQRPIPYAILVDQEEIRIFQWDGEQLSKPICRIPTATVLSHYEPEFGSKEIFHSYLECLVEAWLRDLAYHWKSANPPSYDRLEAIGLAGRLHNGTVLALSLLST